MKLLLAAAASLLLADAAVASREHVHHHQLRHQAKRDAHDAGEGEGEAASSSSSSSSSSMSSSSSSASADEHSYSNGITMETSSLSRSVWTDSDSSDDILFETDCSFIEHDELEAALRFVVCGGGKKKACPRDFPTQLYENGLPGDGGHDEQYRNTPESGGLGLNAWAVVVNRAGRVCAVAKSGPKFDSAWSYARIEAAAKASTANGFSTDKFAFASHDLYPLVSNEEDLWYGIENVVPMNAAAAYEGSVARWGNRCSSDDDDDDPLCGKRLGGTSRTGGGLALYNKHGKKLGAVGVAGDCPCTNHILAWKIRFLLEFDYVTTGLGVGDRRAKDGRGLINAATDNMYKVDTCIRERKRQNEKFLDERGNDECAKLDTCDSTARAIIAPFAEQTEAGVARLPPVRNIRPADDDDDDSATSSTLFYTVRD